MDIYLTDSSRHTLGILPVSASIDIDIGVDDDYGITIPLEDYDKNIVVTGGYWFVPGTEYGGMLCNPLINTASKTVTFSGDTFRGMLKRKVADPGTENYLGVSGTSAAVLTALVNQNNQFGSLFTFSGSGNVTSTNARWEPVLEVIYRICDWQNYRLDVKANESSNGTLSVNLELVQVVDQEDIEYSQDQGFNFKIQNVTDRFNYVVALGSGELKDRMVAKYSVDKRNRLTEVTSIPAGVNNRIYVYDWPNAESKTRLSRMCQKKMREVNKKSEYSMTIPEDFDFDIGENVRGRDYVTGTQVNAYVSRKVVKISNGVVSTSYSLK